MDDELNWCFVGILHEHIGAYRHCLFGLGVSRREGNYLWFNGLRFILSISCSFGGEPSCWMFS
jgi:hypothetical protein